jgi:very-short-patch-repair endonuclease
MGLRVARFGNDEVVKGLSAVVEKIKAVISN